MARVYHAGWFFSGAVLVSNLLIVDNDPDILELLALGLESEGHRVRTANGGTAALREIERELPEVLITDLVMPNISGEKLIRIVRSIPAWASLRTIVISGVAIEAPDLRPRIPCDIYIAKGPIAQTLQYVRDSLNNFERMALLSRETALGTEGIYSRHVTRELMEVNEDVERILNQVSDGVCRLDADTRLVWINVSFARLLSMPEETILGRPVGEILGADTGAVLAELIHAGEAAGRRERDILLPDGRRTRAILLASVEGADRLATILWQDITDRLLLEEQYENIVESANDLIWTTDPDGRITYLSRAATRLLAREPQDLIGRVFWEAVPVSERASLQTLLSELLQWSGDATESSAGRDAFHDSAVSEWEFHPDTADDGPRWMQLRISRLRDRGGQTIGLQGTATDITAQRRLLQEKESLLHEVHHRVRDNLQLIASLARLSDPELLESRIAAFSEIFHELYEERSFAYVAAAPIIERVAAAAAQSSGSTALMPERLHVSVGDLPMRTAVPLALILNEIIHDAAVHQADERPEGSELRFTESGGSSTARYQLILTVGHPSADARLEPFREDGFVRLMLDQIDADGGMKQSDRGLRYEIRFS